MSGKDETGKIKKKKSEAVWTLPPVMYSLILTGSVFGLCMARSLGWIEVYKVLIFTFFGSLTTGYAVKKYFPYSETDPDFTGLSLNRFWVVNFASAVLVLVFTYLPNTSWPIVAVFVLTGLFGTPGIGIISGSTLLMTSVLLTQGGAPLFFLYFLSGVFAIICFLPLEKDVKITFPMILSMIGLFICEVSGIMIAERGLFGLEQLLLPIVNIILTSILIFFGVRFYATKVVFKYRDLYQRLGDTEHPALQSLKETNKKKYMQSIHTAYFCDRIGLKLGLDNDILKCAAYLHTLVPSKAEERESFYDEMEFTGAIKMVLDEFADYMNGAQSGTIIRKESAALLCAHTIVKAVLMMYEKHPDSKPDVDKLTEAAFARFTSNGTFDKCEISIGELGTLKKIFTEDKLYYDFLR